MGDAVLAVVRFATGTAARTGQSVGASLAICRRIGMSRKAVRKLPRSGATEFCYVPGEPDRLLTENAGRASWERLTLMRAVEELRGLVYGGGYDAVTRHACGWQPSPVGPD
jgi:hypothetical protein